MTHGVVALCLVACGNRSGTGGAARDPASAAVDALAGAWEGEIPRAGAPIRLELRFARERGAWTGALDLPGDEGIPMAKLRFEPPRVEFEVDLGEPVPITGRLERDRLQLAIDLGEAKPVEVELARIPPLAAPANRVEAWQQDLDAIATRYFRFDRSFSTEARARALDELAALRRDVAKLDDPHLIARLSRVIAGSGNAHTRLYLLRNRTALRRYPIRLYWFGDELRVVRATHAHADLLGCRVQSIGGHDPTAVREAVSELFAGNRSWQLYKSTYFMTSPEILFGLDLIPAMDSLEVVAACEGGARTVSLAPLPLAATARPTEAWRDLVPGAGDGDWSSALTGAVPLYLSKPEVPYWLAQVDDGRAIYVHYNRAKARDDLSIDELTRQIIAALDRPRADRLIVDLRFNTGGDNSVAWPMFDAVAAHPKLQRSGSLFVLVSRATFSAGISHTVQLAETGRATIVGEPVGDELDTWSEGGNLVLPNSKLVVHYCNGFHGYSKRAYPDREPFFKDLSVDSVAPAVFVTPTWADYVAKRDPLLDAALAR